MDNLSSLEVARSSSTLLSVTLSGHPRCWQRLLPGVLAQGPVSQCRAGPHGWTLQSLIETSTPQFCSTWVSRGSLPSARRESTPFAFSTYPPLGLPKSFFPLLFSYFSFLFAFIAGRNISAFRPKSYKLQVHKYL